MKNKIKKSFFGILLVCLLVAVGSVTAFAQHGYRVTKRVAFKKGEISISIKGIIPNTLEAHEYIIRSRKGQTMHIKLSSRRKDLNFAVVDSKGNWLDADNDLKSWTNELTETGDYKIIVTTRTKGIAAYMLKIQIAKDI